jgi:hypothetical protein
MRHLCTACVILSSLLPLLAQDAPVQAPAAGITVEGTGTAMLPADTLEYRAMLITGGVTPADAMVEYDRATARLPKALDQLGIDGLAYELRGIVVSSLTDEQFRQRQRNAMSYGGQVPNKCVVKDYVTVRVPVDGQSAKDVRNLVIAILGVSMELGLEDPEIRRQLYDPYGRPVPSEAPEGWTAGVSFVLRDPSELYAAAVRGAIADAVAKADLQAGLVGGKRGRIVAVETLSGGAVEPGKMLDLQHRVVLRVRYELAGN